MYRKFRASGDFYIPAIELIDVKIGYGNEMILKGVNLKVYPGEKVAIMGRSGSGKTTLLKTISGLLKPFKGSVRIFGRDLYQERFLNGKIAYIPQNIGLINSANVLYNVLLARASLKPINFLLNIWSRRDQKDAMDVLDIVKLRDKFLSKVEKLSGGEKQRVAIARALYQGADILLADEPVSNLDLETAAEVLNVITEVSQKGIAIVAVMHDIQLTHKYFDKIYILEKGVLREKN